MIIDDFQIDAL